MSVNSKNITDLLRASVNLKNILLLVVALSFFGSSFGVIKFGPIHLFPYRIGLIMFVFCLLLAVIYYRANYQFKVKVDYYLLFFILWIIYALCSFFWSLSKADALLNILNLSCNILIIIFIIIHITSIRDLKKLYSVWLIMLLISVAVGLWNYKTGLHFSSSSLFEAPVHKRFAPTAYYVNQNDFATYLAMSIPFLISCVRYNVNWIKKSLGITLLLVSFIALLATNSRANIIGLSAGLLFWFIFLLRYREKYLILFLIALVLMAGLVYFIYADLALVPDAFEGLKQISINSTDKSTIARINLIKNSILFFIDSYGFGVGAGNVEHYMSNYAYVPVGRHINVHNWWLELLANYGVIVLFGYILFFISLCRNLYHAFLKLERRVELMICEPLLVGLIIFVFGSLSPSSVMTFNPQWLLIAFALAFLNYYRTEGKSRVETDARAFK